MQGVLLLLMTITRNGEVTIQALVSFSFSYTRIVLLTQIMKSMYIKLEPNIFLMFLLYISSVFFILYPIQQANTGRLLLHIQLLLICSDSNPTSQQLNKARLLFTFSPVNLWCKAREIRNSAVQGTSTPPINPNKIKNTWSR